MMSLLSTLLFLVGLGCSATSWTTRPPCTRPQTTPRPWTTQRPDGLRNGTCNFDNVPCGFMQDTNDQLDFTLHHGSTPSFRTGPSGDHTSGHGKYIYVEATGQKPGAVAHMHHFLYLRRQACLFFHYHMYGAAMGTLKVFINKRLVWKLHGNQGDQWLKGTIPITSAGLYRIDFEGVVGDSYTSDIALDDLGYQEYYSIYADVCDITPSCAHPGNQTTPPATPSPPISSPPISSPPISSPPISSPPISSPPISSPPISSPPISSPLPHQNDSCGRPAVPPARVIGGMDVSPGSWPWQVALKVFGRFVCGGSLIAPRWVLTAAHCIYQGITYEIVLGDHNRSISEGTEQSINSANITVHPNWNTSTIDSDIALIYLSRPAMINQRVRTVCLPRQDEVVSRSARCYITGWGKIRHPGSSHHTLQQALLPIVSKRCCQKKLAASPGGSGLRINNNMVCAGKEGSIKGGCHGDSGGPFVCQASNGRWVLQGAVSWGSPRCNTRERFTVFARVARFRNWIDYHMNSRG